MANYVALRQQFFSIENYSIVPIRYEDRFDIMKWRNEQIYHLRQKTLLTVDDQENYFRDVVSQLFSKEKPIQILFSYMENNICIGYGGLVHINWIDKNAEISFIIKTELEKDYFEFHWITFLGLIEEVAFKQIHLHKIFTFAFDIRQQLYHALLKSNYTEEARLRQHCIFEGKFIDVVIHSKINK